MELTGLFNKFKKNSRLESGRFLAIQIDPEFVKTAVWTIENQLTSLVAVGSTQEWDGVSTEILLEAVDSSLASALEKLSQAEKPDPNQVIFGLPETWATEEGVAQPRLVDLKVLCEKLALKPLGFVVTTEAIVHYLKSKEGTPLTAILIKTSTSEVAVSLVKLGKLEGTHAAGRSGDLASDVREALTRFGTQESLPSRMVLFDGGEDLSDLSQQLLAFDWQAHLSFLHLPSIEPAPEDFSISAIAVAGGAEVAKSLGFTVSEILPEGKTKLEFSKPVSEEEKKEIAETTEKEKFNFLPILKNIKIFEKIKTVLAKFKNLIPIISTGLTKIINVFRRLTLFSGTKLTALFTILIALFILGSVIFVARIFPKATVQIIFAAQSLSDRVKIVVDPSVSIIDPANNTLPANKETMVKSGSKSIKATGQKTTGNKATGKVTIYNHRTDGGKTFSAGTILTKDKLKFITDKDVAVASASGTIESTIYGKATVDVIAAEFGQEYNLPAGAEFQIGDFSRSTYAAKNDEPFTGGTKNSISIISQKDQSSLRNDLLGELKDQAASEIISRSKDKRVFAETLSIKPKEEKFSADIGEEADSLSLDLTAEITALAIEDKNFNDLLSMILRDKIPAGFTLATDDLQIEVEKVETIDDKLNFEAVIKAKLSPAISESDIVSRIAGKRPSLAMDQIKSLPYFKSATLDISPGLPSFFRWLPKNSNRISIEIKSEE